MSQDERAAEKVVAIRAADGAMESDSEDRELQAIEDSLELLWSFDQRTRRRILTYLTDREYER